MAFIALNGRQAGAYISSSSTRGHLLTHKGTLHLKRFAEAIAALLFPKRSTHSHRRSWERRLRFERLEDRNLLTTVNLFITQPTTIEDSTSPALFSLVRSNEHLDQSLTVDYSIAGSAALDTDYQTAAGSVTFSPYQTSITLAVVPIDDSLLEGPETVIVSLVASEDSDKFKVTTFQFLGPHNVPNYSRYAYGVTGAPVYGGAAESRWDSEANGTIVGEGTPDDVEILWSVAGAAVGKASYQASSDDAIPYRWDFETNIVDVKIETPDDGVAFKPSSASTPIAQGLDAQGRLLIGANSANVAAGENGLQWFAKITLSGPNGNRGVNFIRVGFNEVLMDYTSNAYYHNEGSLRSSIQGTAPLFDQAEGFTCEGFYALTRDSYFFTSSRSLLTTTITSQDNPRDAVPLTYDQGPSLTANDATAFLWNHRESFQLNVIANGIEKSFGSEHVYTRLATTSWSFQATGSIGISAAGSYVWSPQAGGGVILDSPQQQWEMVTDGSRPLRVDGPRLNDELDRVTFDP